MLRLTFTVVLLTIIFQTFAQNIANGNQVSVFPFWSKGDFRELTIKHKREKFDSGALTESSGSTYRVLVRVTEVKEDGYIIEWVYKNVIPSENAGELEKRFAKMTEGYKTIFKINKQGVFMAVQNQAEMKKHFEKSIDMVQKTYGNDSISMMVFQLVKGIFSSPEIVESVFTRDVRIYHSVFGINYTLNKPILGDALITNPFGSQPVEATETITMTDLQFKKDMCRIQGVQQIKKDEAEKLVREVLKGIAAQAGKILKDNFDLPPVDIKDTFTHDIELSTGWVKRAYYKRESRFDNNYDYESYEITMN